MGPCARRELVEVPRAYVHRIALIAGDPEIRHTRADLKQDAPRFGLLLFIAGYVLAEGHQRFLGFRHPHPERDAERPRDIEQSRCLDIDRLLGGELCFFAPREDLASVRLAAGIPLRQALELFPDSCQFASQARPSGAIFRPRNHDHGRGIADVAVHHRLSGVAKECGQRIVIALRERIELVIVASGAADGEAQPYRAGRVHAVLGVDGLVFFRNNTGFVGRDIAALETGGDQLIERWGRQQVARKLFDGELIEGQVAVERLNHPVAIGPHLAVVVDVDPVGVAVPRRIQPVAGAMLAPCGRFEQPVHHLFVRAGRPVVNKALHHFGPRRESRHVE